MSRQRITVTTAVAIVAFLTGGWFMQQGSRRDESVYQRARLFDDVLSHVADYYVETIDEKDLYRLAIDGLLRELNDPYTGFLDARELRALNETTTGNYGGLGIQIEVRDQAIVVVAPLPETPAERAGIITGDRIVQVNDSSTARWNQDQAVRALRGPQGTQVTIRIERPGVNELLTFRLTRAQIHARSVRLAALLDNGVGYVELQQFSEATARELTQALDSLKQAGMRSLVLDLRTNPGGLLDEGLAVSDLFLDAGQEIVSTRGRAPGATRRFTDRAPQRYPSLPIVVLINSYSASASEIVAGALQDHDRAVVVGTTSFGKGLVQSVFRLSNEASLKMTTSKWYTPSGRSIQRPRRAADRDGDPDEVAAARDTARQTYRTDGGRTVTGGGGIAPDVVVTPDSALNALGRRLQQVLGSDAVKYTDALAAFALEARAQRAVASPMFPVTPAMRERLLGLLAQRGVTLDRQVVEAVQPFVDRQLASQTARFVFGRAGEVQRQSQDDPVMERAVQLAGRARTPAELLTLATREAAAPNRQ